jgi:hypothetical protein
MSHPAIQQVRQAFICYLLFAICHSLRQRLCETLGKAKKAVRSERALEIRPAAGGVCRNLSFVICHLSCASPVIRFAVFQRSRNKEGREPVLHCGGIE